MTGLKIIAPLVFSFALFAQGPSELISVNWQQLTALAALIVVLIFIIVKYLPDRDKADGKKAETFAGASKEQTKSCVDAIALAAGKASDAAAAMSKHFTDTLDKMHERYHDDNTSIVDALNALAQNCAANGSGATIHALRKQREEEHGK